MGRKLNFRNVQQMLRNMLIGTSVNGMYLRMIMKLIQEKNTAKAPICHCQGVEHQHSLSKPIKMMVEMYKAQ